MNELKGYFGFISELRKFVMKNYNLSTEIDDLSVTEGFLKMKFLSHIELCSKNVSLIKKEDKKYLVIFSKLINYVCFL